MKFGPVHIDHIGIAVDSLEQGSTFWRLIGLIEHDEDELVELGHAEMAYREAFSREFVLSAVVKVLQTCW